MATQLLGTHHSQRNRIKSHPKLYHQQSEKLGRGSILFLKPKKPTGFARQSYPNPLPDRKALDDIVFDALGLTEDERKEVYWAVAELVKNRLDKARSV